MKEIIALIATSLVVGSYIPQLYKTYKTKSAKDLSWLFLIIIFVGVFMWSIYGILNNDMTFFIANAIILLCSGSLIVLKWIYN